MRLWLAALAAVLGCAQAWADAPAVGQGAELRFLSEHAVEGMHGGNLSGLAQCGGVLWTVSDRDDDRLYSLRPDETPGSVWPAETETFNAPGLPDSGLSWGARARTWLYGLLRGGALDFEGVSCDAKGNRYLVSEAYAGVLQVPPAGAAQWLELPPTLLRQARAAGLLMVTNAYYEGLALDADGKQLWLAAERQRRGLLHLRNDNGSWKCDGACVLFSEGGTTLPPPQLGSDKPLALDFSDLSLYQGKLFTLERLVHQICRRDPASGAAERCWSFAEGALAPQRRYALPYGVAEALVIDDKGAWIGLDNGDEPRADGDARPYVLRFAAPAEGWLGGK
ncbi:esterase-like activity of phytase family protein [Pseudomonas citronellolis]|uniref:esterase-like activity of phytase family protein n=1 Tax=Pseudomonas citronellolis TaxID=53408 RepID=UPI0023E459C0|nr:esterase-like activity of phytase family protein [Pseudomonas citronellolis]MDF3933613.1 esterase-like activity of phytase family protein [Pseudomonas citronellolis]